MSVHRRIGPFRSFCKSTAAAASLIFLLLSGFFILCLAAAFSPLLSGGGFDALFSVHVVKAASYTVRQAAVSTAIASVVGVSAAFFTARRRFPLRRFLTALSPLPLCLPPLLMALGYVLAFGMQGTVNRILAAVLGAAAPPLTFLYSFAGLVLVHGFYNFPLVMHTVSDVWERLPPDESDAAVLLGASPVRVFRTVTLAQLLPAILSSCLLVFLYCFFSFIIVLLFGTVGGSTLEVEIYQAARTAVDFRTAAALSAAETLLALCFVGAYSLFSQRAERSRGISFLPDRAVRKPLSGPSETAFAVLLFFAVALFFIIPLLAIAMNAFTLQRRYGSGSGGIVPSFTLKTFAALFSRRGFYSALYNTVITAAVSALLAAAGAAFYAYAFLSRELFCSDKNPSAQAVRILPMFPMAVSSVVMGFGMMMLVKEGSPGILAAAQAALFWPFALRQIAPGLARIPPAAAESARLLSPFRLDVVFRIYLPATARNCVSAFCFCFALSCGDTGLPLALGIPDFDTLALYTYRLAGSYRLNEACACGLVLGFIAAAVFAAGDAAAGRRKK